MSEPDDDAPQFRVDHLRPVDHAIARAIMGETWQQSALAAGWVPPEEAEALRLRIEAWHVSTTANANRAADAEARVAELEASWVPPERVEEIDCPARTQLDALTAPELVHPPVDYCRFCRGGGKLRIVRDEAMQ